MLEFLTPIAAPIGLSNADLLASFVALVFFGTFAALGSGKAYSAFYGAVVGIGIYIVLQTLLGPAYQTPETSKLLWPGISKFLIGSSAYLIPILFFLGPVNGSLRINGFSHPALRAVESGAVSLFAVALVCTASFGFMSKSYVFTADTAFTLLKESASFSAFLASSKALTYLVTHMQTIVVAAILFGIYKAFFAEIVSAAVLAAFRAVMSRSGKGRAGHDDHGGHEDHGGHDEHDEHGHDEHDDHGHDDHGGHEDHGHGHGHH